MRDSKHVSRTRKTSPETHSSFLSVQDISNKFVIREVEGAVILFRLFNSVKDGSQILDPILALNSCSIVSHLPHLVRNRFPHSKVSEIVLHLPLHFRRCPHF